MRRVLCPVGRYHTAWGLVARFDRMGNAKASKGGASNNRLHASVFTLLSHQGTVSCCKSSQEAGQEQKLYIMNRTDGGFVLWLTGVDSYIQRNLFPWMTADMKANSGLGGEITRAIDAEFWQIVSEVFDTLSRVDNYTTDGSTILWRFHCYRDRRNLVDDRGQVIVIADDNYSLKSFYHDIQAMREYGVKPRIIFLRPPKRNRLYEFCDVAAQQGLAFFSQKMTEPLVNQMYGFETQYPGITININNVNNNFNNNINAGGDVNIRVRDMINQVANEDVDPKREERPSKGWKEYLKDYIIQVAAGITVNGCGLLSKLSGAM